MGGGLSINPTFTREVRRQHDSHGSTRSLFVYLQFCTSEQKDLITARKVTNLEKVRNQTLWRSENSVSYERPHDKNRASVDRMQLGSKNVFSEVLS